MTEPLENEKTLFPTKSTDFYAFARVLAQNGRLSSSCNINWKMIEKNHTFGWIDFWFRFVRELSRESKKRGLIPPQIQDKLVEDDDDDDLPELVPC